MDDFEKYAQLPANLRAAVVDGTQVPGEPSSADLVWADTLQDVRCLFFVTFAENGNGPMQ